MSWKPSTSEVLPDQFATVVAQHDVTVLHFWASWNLHDKSMDTVLAKIASEFKGRVFIGSVHADDPRYNEACRELKVLNLPALVTFVNGKHFETVIGLHSEDHLKLRLRGCLDSAGAHQRVQR